jgi:hypothetical protein
MVLHTSSKQGVETFQELGDRFNLVTLQRAEKHFKDMITEQFGDYPEMAKDVFAIISSYTPGMEDIYLYADDWHILYCSNGNRFLRLQSPVYYTKESNVHPAFEQILSDIKS